MANHWPVVVGINQYQAIQPLMYAQFDAIELKDFLVNEAGLPAEQCALLTDVSPMVYQTAAYPTREAILQQVIRACQTAAPDDLIWFFFSGYGVHWEGQDMLLPIDADPSRIVDTAIPLQTIFEHLKQSATQQCLVMLDMNRSQAALPNQRLGTQTLELAKSLDIPLVMSCRPDQFSQETLAVRHGLFTQAVLEGLRFHGCLTLSQLVAYLNDRVPELCSHHWRPVQNPVVMMPTNYQFQLLLPPSAVTHLSRTDQGAIPPTWPNQVMPPPGITPLPSTGIAAMAPLSGDAASPVPAPESIAPLPTTDRQLPSSAPVPDAAPVAEPAEPVEPAEPAMLRWQWGGLVGIGLLLLLGVFMRNQAIFVGSEPSTTEPEEATPADLAPAADTPIAADAPAPGAEQPLFTPNVTDATAQTNISPLERAQAAIAQNRFGEALTWLDQVPMDQRNDQFATLLDQAQQGYQSTNQTNQSVLDSARMMIEPISASLFSDAIERARQVPVGDPYYDQAQTDINRWSQVILDLAEGRAATGNFDQAIAAAQLVPDDRAEIYQTAQERIQHWQQQKTNQNLLQQAQGMLVPDQATSLQAAINLVKQIPPDYPEAEIAQKRIDQWSQDILVIARARAAAGQYPGAISAAQLVPEGSSSFDQAQQEIQRWQGQQ